MNPQITVLKLLMLQCIHHQKIWLTLKVETEQKTGFGTYAIRLTGADIASKYWKSRRHT
jgi:hypothetical protein